MADNNRDEGGHVVNDKVGLNNDEANGSQVIGLQEEAENPYEEEVF